MEQLKLALENKEAEQIFIGDERDLDHVRQTVSWSKLPRHECLKIVRTCNQSLCAGFGLRMDDNNKQSVSESKVE